MKKYYSASAFFITLAVALSFSSGVAHAATCTPPTRPVCYVTVIVPPGEIDGVVVPTTKQVIGPSDSCSQSEYISEQADYISCLAVSKAASTPTSLSDLVGQSAADNLNCMQQFGSWSTYDENSHSCVDTKQSELSLICASDSNYGPNSFYDLSQDKCTCKSGYSLQLDSSVDKLRCVLPKISPDEAASIKTSAKTILSSYYPNTVDSLTAVQGGYSTPDSSITASLSAAVEILQKASDAAASLNSTYKGESLDSNSTNILYSLTTGTIVCLATAQVMLKVDSIDIIQEGLKKCTGWSDSLNKLLGTSSPLADQTSTSASISPTSPAPTVSNADTIIAQRKAALGMPLGKITEKYGASPATTSVVVATTTTPGMTPAEAQAWIYGTATTTPKQMHWYEWLNPINWFSWLH